MATYRYLFGHWQTARVDVEIPLFGVHIQGKLNDVGYIQGSLQLDQESKTGISNDILVAATVPFKTFVVVLRDGSPVWGGYITSRTYQSQSKSIQLYARAYEGYPDERIIPLAEYNPGANPSFTATNEDQGNTFIRLINDFTFDETPAGPLFPLHFEAADSNIPFGSQFFNGLATGVLKSVEVFRKDYKTYRQIIDELANGEDGFDWRIVPRLEIGASVITSPTGDLPGSIYDPDPAIEVHKYVLFGYPELHSGQSHDAFVFEYPGNILNYYRTDNLAGAGTTTIGIGSGQGEAMLVKEVANQDLIEVHGGFFGKDVVVSMKHIDTQAVLDSRTMQENTKRKPPKVTYKVSVRPSLAPVFGTYDLGSPATLIITDAMHPTTTRVQVRVNEYTLRPPSEDGGAEEIDLGFVGEFE